MCLTKPAGWQLVHVVRFMLGSWLGVAGGMP